MKLRLIFFFATVISLLSSPVNATVCRLPGLNGYKLAKERGLGIIGKQTTSRPEEAVIYIEKAEKGYWYHSNYITPGHKEPTKIGEETPISGSDALLNILYDKQPLPSEWRDAEELYKTQTKIYLDVSLLDSNGKPKIDLGDAKNIYIVDGQKRRTISGDIASLKTDTPPPSLMKKILGCCLYGVPPQSPVDFLRNLSSRRLDRKEVRVASLVNDTATRQFVNSSSALSKASIVPKVSDIKSESDVRQVLAGAKGRTLVLVSHVEGESYVIRSPDNKKQFEMPIAQLRNLAREHDVDLIDLGCKTAKLLEQQAGVGVVDSFNTLSAVRKLEAALDNAKTLAEFYETLTADGLTIVLHDATMKDGWTQQRAEIFSLKKLSDQFVKIAELFLSFRDRKN